MTKPKTETLQASPAWKSPTKKNPYRENEIYRRFRSIACEMARKSTSVEDPDFERRVLERFSNLKKEFSYD